MHARDVARRFRNSPRRNTLLLLLSAGALIGVSQWSTIRAAIGPPRQKDMTLDAAMRQEVVESLIANLNRYYVFPEKARQIEASLRAQQQRGAYDAVSSAEQLAALLTSDVKAISKDAHLEVLYSEDAIPQRAADEAPPADEQARDLARMKRLNFGVETAGRLKHNIGYLDLHAFAPPELVKARIAAAMTLLADTRALIIDLRMNHGGQPETVALLASYLFSQRTHLNDIYIREGDHTQEFWTSDTLDGPRYGDARKVYILTSKDTFSAGEDFAYALKNLERATLVGETTGGGAHPGEPRRLAAHFEAFVPGGRSISPITHTDWEGVGVAPDLAVSASKALDAAQVQILKDFLAVETDPMMREMMQERIAELD